MHEGKKQLLITRPDFERGNASNDWASVFGEFADDLEKHTTNGRRELLECNYSNTTATL
jgi:hypothetical protein